MYIMNDYMKGRLARMDVKYTAVLMNNNTNSTEKTK